MTDDRDLDGSEALRKAIHIAIGFGAIALRWLTSWQAAAICLGAFFFNWLILPRVGGRRLARTSRGYDRGILLYPLAVFGLIVAFPNDPEIAGAAWVTLAFGDGAATLVGRNFGRRRIPWNHDKSLLGTFAFIEVALPAAYAISLFLSSEPTPLPRFVIIAAAVLIAALVETLPIHVDDNVTVPFTCAAVLFALTHWIHAPSIVPDRNGWIWLAINAALAVAGYFARAVDISGLIGGWLLGAVLILFGGWQLYAVLLAFFVIGSVTTKLGYRDKKERGIAEEGEDGRRGFSHAFSNTGVAAILVFLIVTTDFDQPLLWLMAAASLATATADTVSSEIGKWLGRRTFLPLTFKPVPAGTEGAISIEGTVAGVMAGFFVAVLAALLQASRFSGRALGDLVANAWNEPKFIAVVTGVTVAAAIGSWVESIAGSWNRTRETPVPNGALNFFNTLVGAFALLAIVKLR